MSLVLIAYILRGNVSELKGFFHLWYINRCCFHDLGAPVGSFSAPLKQIAQYMKDNVYQHNYANDLVWLDLSTTETMVKIVNLTCPPSCQDVAIVV